MIHYVVFSITVLESIPKGEIYSNNESIKVRKLSDNTSIIDFMYADFIKINLVELADKIHLNLLKLYDATSEDMELNIIVEISDNSKSLVNIPEYIFRDLGYRYCMDLKYKDQLGMNDDSDDEDEDEDLIDIEGFMDLLDQYVDYPDDDPDEEDDDEESEDDDTEDIDDIFGMFGVDCGVSSKSNRSRGTSHNSSRSFAKAKNKKENIKNHGILIANKDHIDRDRKIVKKFLKEFIPGDSNYAQAYRKRILNRWMSVYAISKKQANEIEREFRKKGRKKSIKTADVLTETSRNILRNYYSSSFYDVTK